MCVVGVLVRAWFREGIREGSTGVKDKDDRSEGSIFEFELGTTNVAALSPFVIDLKYISSRW